MIPHKGRLYLDREMLMRGPSMNANEIFQNNISLYTTYTQPFKIRMELAGMALTTKQAHDDEMTSY